MSRELVLAIDIGTSSLKAGLIDQNGSLVRLARDTVFLGREEIQDWNAELWVARLAELVSSLPSRGEIVAVAVSGNGPTIVPVDKKGRALSPTLLWLDEREEGISGQKSYFLPKVAWLRDSRPEVFERAERFFSCPEFVDFILTGEAVTVSPSEEFSAYVWDCDSIAAYGFEAAQFPSFIGVGDRIGAVTVGAARRFGIPQGVPVFAGGPDFFMSLVGTGALVPGRTCDRAGTSEAINYCAAEPIQGTELRTLPHVIAGRYNVAAILSSTGRLFEWFRRISGQEGTDYLGMLSDMSRVRHDSVPWFFPSIHEGGRWEFGTGMFIGLGADHGKPEMGWAVAESIGYAVREAVAVLEASGCEIDEIRTAGGQARNQIWNQMKADMSGKPFVVPKIEDAELVGNACCAFLGLGRYADLIQASEDLVQLGERFQPDPSEYERYTESYERYVDAYSRFRNLYREIADSFDRDR